MHRPFRTGTRPGTILHLVFSVNAGPILTSSLEFTAMPEGDHLTLGERAVVSALAKGLRPHAIARELSVHIGFVRATLSGLRLRFGARDVADLVERVEREGPTDPGCPTASFTAQTEVRSHLFADESFLASLGPERTEVPCRREGCIAGAIGHSVMCRRHHVDMLRRACGNNQA